MHLEIHLSLILSILVMFFHIVNHFIAPFPSIYLTLSLKTESSRITIGSVRWELITGQYKGKRKDLDWVRRIQALSSRVPVLVGRMTERRRG